MKEIVEEFEESLLHVIKIAGGLIEKYSGPKDLKFTQVSTGNSVHIGFVSVNHQMCIHSRKTIQEPKRDRK